MSIYRILANAPLQIDYEKVKNILSRERVIALDGIANTLKEWNLFPSIILGDFDSVSTETRSFFKDNGVEVIHAPCQNSTDLEKAIALCDARNAEAIEIYNALGGRTDHTLGNLSFLKKCYRKARTIKLYHEKECIEYLEDICLKLKGSKGDPLALLGFPEAHVTSQGFAYDMRKYFLGLGKSESISNCLAANTANLSIQGQVLFICSENIRMLPVSNLCNF